ncbi:MAG: amino acid adenylation domain-containing protein [Thiohalocapsa sp.]
MSNDEVALVGVEDAYALSPAQAGMLYHSIAEPGSGAYLGCFSAMLPRDVDLFAFKAAWEVAISRHGALRTQFVWEGLDDPVQVVREEAAPVWNEVNWRHLDPEDERIALGRYLDTRRRNGLDLTQAPVMHFALMELVDGRRRFVWVCHHALIDDWSAATILKEIARTYNEHLPEAGSGSGPSMPFRVFIDWLDRCDQKATETYWRGVMDGLTVPTRMQTLTAGVAHGSRDPFRLIETTLSAEASSLLRELAASLRVTLNALVTAAWSVVLHRCSGQDDVLFGVAYAQRPPELPGIEDAVGNFVTTLPARVRLDRRETLHDLILERHIDAIDASQHSSIALPALQRLSGFTSNQPLFDTIVALEKGAPDGGAVPQGPDPLFTDLVAGDQSNFPIALLVFPNARIGLRLMYDPGLFDESGARLVLSMAKTAFSALPAYAGASPFDLPIMPEAERIRAVDGDSGAHALPDFGMVHEEFVSRARAAPEAPAVIFNQEVLSYGSLDRQSEAWARLLLARGLGSGDRIAIFLDPGPGFVVAILGILRSGSAYVPLDARYPSERLNQMLEACGAAAVITTTSHLTNLPSSAPTALLFDSPGEDRSEEIELPRAASDQAAYVIYTSGSTGDPKGVLVTHGNLSASTSARLGFYDEPPKRFLLLSSFSFDSSVGGIFWTLCTGGTLVLSHSNAETNMALLGEILSRNGITHTLCLPSLYEMILAYVPVERLTSLRTVIAAGEALPHTLVDLHSERLPKVRFFNEYGPTEATVWCTAAEVTDLGSTGRTPIGKPIPGARTVLLDSRLRPVPDGLPAELFVGGAGVAAGYIGSPTEMAERFVRDPSDSSRMLYRTGDLVRRQSSGLLEYIGRVDNQIKVRGYRIEPAEVEAVFARRSDIRQAVVIPYGTGAQTGLAAYVVPKPESEHLPERESLQAYAREMLPEWMVPSCYIMINALPRTTNGKVDLHALPPPDRHGDDNRPSILPRTPLERDLARVWKRVLWLDRDLGITEDFFDLGGHSLLSIRLVNEIETELGLKLPMAGVGKISTIADQARLLEAATTDEKVDERVPSQDETGPFVGFSESQLRDFRAHMAGWQGEPAYSDSSILLLNPDGKLAPLFWCFNAAHEFAQMARYLGPNQPIYGMRSGNLVLDFSDETQQRDNNRRVAMHYVSQLLHIESEGPFFLGGNCQGAAIVMELALVLQSLGLPVALVILMEAVPIQLFHGRVALVFGRESAMNPFVEFAQPSRRWRRQFDRFSCDLIGGVHGGFFSEPHVQELCTVVEKRLAEARLDTPYPLPNAACNVEWLALQEVPSLVTGERRCLQVSLRNASRYGWGPTEETGIRLANRWLGLDGEPVVSLDGATTIDARWSPGETRLAKLWITAPQQPGRWRLEVDLVEEGVARFATHGQSPMTADVMVLPRKSGWAGWNFRSWWRRETRANAK